MKPIHILPLLALALFAPVVNANAGKKETVTLLGEEWHRNAVRKGTARAEAEFLRTANGVAHLAKLTAVDTELNDLYANYVNISRVDPATDEGKKLHKERRQQLDMLQARKKQIERDYENLKKTNPEYREILLKHLQSNQRAEMRKEERTKALQREIRNENK